MRLKPFLHEIFAKLGFGLERLSSGLACTNKVLKAINEVLKNPIADGLLARVLPPEVVAQFPRIEGVLAKVIMDLTTGSAIQADIDAAPDTEAKLRVFIADMQRYGATRQSMFLQKLESLMLAGLDDKVLKQNVYDLYTQAEYCLGKVK
jgi:hypothetical protein